MIPLNGMLAIGQVIETRNKWVIERLWRSKTKKCLLRGWKYILGWYIVGEEI